MSKLFFYRIDAGQLLAELVKLKSYEEKGKFAEQLALDLVDGKGNLPFSKAVIAEAKKFSAKKSEAGKKGMKNRWLRDNSVITNDNNDIAVLPDVITRRSRSNNKENIIGEQVPTKKKDTLFFPPSSPEVQAYMDEIGYSGNGASFCDYYQSKGWMIGKNKMKDWKAAVRTWKQNGYNSKKGDKRNELSEEEYDNYRIGLLERMQETRNRI